MGNEVVVELLGGATVTIRTDGRVQDILSNDKDRVWFERIANAVNDWREDYPHLVKTTEG